MVLKSYGYLIYDTPHDTLIKISRNYRRENLSTFYFGLYLGK